MTPPEVHGDRPLVVYEDLEVTGVFVFDLSTLGRVKALLGKRHPNQDPPTVFRW